MELHACISYITHPNGKSLVDEIWQNRFSFFVGVIGNIDNTICQMRDFHGKVIETFTDLEGKLVTLHDYSMQYQQQNIICKTKCYNMLLDNDIYFDLIPNIDNYLNKTFYMGF